MNRDERIQRTSKVRKWVVARLRGELIGPQPGLPAMRTGVGDPRLAGQEILRMEDPPLIRYGAGILFPRKVRIEEQDQVESPETEPPPAESDQNQLDRLPEAPRLGAGRLEAEHEQEINRANEYLPSAMGLTALVDMPEELIIEIEAGRYEPIVLEGNPGGWTDKDGEDHPYKGWARVPLSEPVRLRRDQLHSGRQSIEKVIPTGSKGIELKLHMHVREPGLHEGSAHSRMITFTLMNATEGGTRRNEECLFQCSFSVRDPNGSQCFFEYPEAPDLYPDEEAADSPFARLSQEERNSLRLLYRTIRVFAVGHGCAPEWQETENSATNMIRTESLPTYEIPPVYPSELPDLELGMEALQTKEISIQAGEDLCALYSEWIDELNQELNNTSDIPDDLLPAANRHIEHARECLNRMVEGLDLLRHNDLVGEAFTEMNRAMLMQQIHYKLSQTPRKWVMENNELTLEEGYEPPDYAGRTNRWRPFQFAFVLMNIK